MALNLSLPEKRDLKPRISVFGVGGAGGNAVNNMIAKALDGVDFVVANTDAQALSQNDAVNKIQLGTELTEGLGAGAKPEVGAGAAEESIEAIVDQLVGSHMCFITAGMGGGTGTGAAPVIAQAARQLGILTVGVVTKPFQFEGQRRMRQAEAGIKDLQSHVDTLIVIPNQNLFRLANEQTTFADAFNLADDVLYQGVKGVTDLMVRPGLINLDFADIRSVMDEMGKAMMGTGEAEGDDRALHAAERAIANPLLDEISLRGARGVLINITGGTDMTLFELDEAANKIREEVDPDANIIVGSTLDPEMNGKLRVSVVATGIDAEVRPVAQPVRSEQRYADDEAPAEVAREEYAPEPAHRENHAPASYDDEDRGQSTRRYQDAPTSEVRSDNSRYYADPEVEGIIEDAPAQKYERSDRVNLDIHEDHARQKREALERLAQGMGGDRSRAAPAETRHETQRRSGANMIDMIKRIAPAAPARREAPMAQSPVPSQSVPPRNSHDPYADSRKTEQDAERRPVDKVDVPAFLRRQSELN